MNPYSYLQGLYARLDSEGEDMRGKVHARLDSMTPAEIEAFENEVYLSNAERHALWDALDPVEQRAKAIAVARSNVRLADEGARLRAQLDQAHAELNHLQKEQESS